MSQTISGYPTPQNICGVMGLLQSGAAFSNAVTSSAMQLSNQITSAVSQLQSLPGSILQQIDLDVAGLASSLQSTAEGAVASLAAHATNQIANLIPNLNMATGQLAAQMGLQNSGCSLPSLGNIGAPGTDPCAAMSNFFNSVMGGGAALISSMGALVSSITSSIQSLATAASGALQGIANSITTAVGSVVNVGSSMASMVAGEVSQLTSAATDILNMTSIGGLFGLMTNPCAASVITANATSAALNYLGNSIPTPGLNPSGASYNS
jgi:hypothetical protein